MPQDWEQVGAILSRKPVYILLRTPSKALRRCPPRNQRVLPREPALTRTKQTFTSSPVPASAQTWQKKHSSSKTL